MNARIGFSWIGAFAAVLAVLPLSAFANTDEIQVYDGEIARPCVFNLTLHDNYTIHGSKMPDFPGGLEPDRSLNGVPEFAYGVTDWFEAGLYLPLYSVTANKGAVLNGFKLRALFVAPDNADRTFFYGVNFEFSYNSRHWDQKKFTSEIRPILGLHLGKVDLVFNPILDNSYTGFSQLDFAPASRIAYHLTPQWTIAAEEYDDFGPLRRFFSGSQQIHQLFAVADYASETIDIEAGIGWGLTRASDSLALKLILSKDLN